MSKHCWALKDKYEAQFAVSFYPLMLSNTKKAEILHRAEEIRVVRNEISEIFFSNMVGFQDMSKFEAYNYFSPMFCTRLCGHYLRKAIEDVWRAYQCWFDTIRKNIEFVKVTEIVPSFYKINTKSHKKGELKSIERHTQKTELTVVLTWIARYGRNNTTEWLEAIIPTVPESKQKFYCMVLHKIKKFGFNRLLRLALSRRDGIYNKYRERGKIIFNSLTFSGRSRISRPIVDARRNDTGRFNYYIELSWDWINQGYHGKRKKTICIPIKYNKSYHRSLKRYSNGDCTSYTIVIRGTDIHIVLARASFRYTNESVIREDNTIGIDVNSKHNMFALSSGEFIPNDDGLISDLEMELLKIDQKHKSYVARCNKNECCSIFKISNKDRSRVHSISLKLNESNKRMISTLCSQFVMNGIQHIVMENLDGFQGNKLHAEDSKGFNLGRLHLRTRLSSLKDEFIHIAPKYGLSVSLVHPEYTSKMCGHCGCIDDRNRQTQEVFKCVECGHTENADIHSAKNIKFRLTSTVLRGYLLERARDNGYRYFQPKSIPRWGVREYLEKCHRNGLFKQSVENHKNLTICKIA